MITPAALYCPDQNLADALHDLAYWHRAGLLLDTVAWVDDSPVVTAEAFAGFIASHRADDANGNWGAVFEVMTIDAGRYMVHISGDALASGHVVSDGMTLADLQDDAGEVSYWPVGDGGTYRLSDCEGWDEWAPVVPPTN